MMVTALIILGRRHDRPPSPHFVLYFYKANALFDKDILFLMPHACELRTRKANSQNYTALTDEMNLGAIGHEGALPTPMSILPNDNTIISYINYSLITTIPF